MTSQVGASVEGRSAVEHPRTVRRLELTCRTCGYSVVVDAPPESCPMCRSAAWEPAPWRPFARVYS